MPEHLVSAVVSAVRAGHRAVVPGLTVVDTINDGNDVVVVNGESKHVIG